MKIRITEGQYKKILKSVEVEEQTDSEPVSPEPEPGTSETQSGHQSYPEVGKWESGVTRGVANQIGNTKWSDGIEITRGKANQLK